jgi:uncharacterized membrane protein YccF (DUF307 family)
MTRSVAVKTIGNLLWLVLAGWWLCLAYLVAGVINCALILTIPLGLQAFKIAGFVLWPFGRSIVQGDASGARVIGNVIWCVTAGLWLAIGHLIAAALLAITVIGLPFAVANVRLAGLALAPFGKKVVRAGSHDALVSV